MKIVVRHELSFPVGSGSAHAVQHLLLTPLSGPGQTIKDWTIEMPGIETAARFTDAYGNRALLVSQTKPEGDLAISIKGTVETIDRNGVLGRIPGEPVMALYKRTTPLTKPDPRIVDGFADAEKHGAGRIALLHGVMDRIGELYSFNGVVVAPGGQSQSQSEGEQSQSQGVPDAREPADAEVFAHAFIGAIRAFDIPARYVTGYLAADEDRPAAFHAWAEAYDEGLGWIAFDAALGVCPTDRHIRVATGLDALATMPVRVAPEAGDVALVSVEVAAQ